MTRPLKSTPFVLSLLALLVLSSHATTAQTCTTTPADQSQVIETMHQFFAAAGADDLQKFHAVTTPTFYAYDGGARFEGDALMTLVKKAHDAGKQYVWTVTEPQVHLSCDAALITYVNKGSTTDSTGTKDRRWLESAFMQKSGGSWKILFLHSTETQ
jgi:ketosteroid isomerase-like protein